MFDAYESITPEEDVTIMTRTEFIRNYWNYYLALENRVLQTTNYIELHPANENAFSNEYAILMQAIGGELDSFFKQYCDFSPTDRKTIADYAVYILTDYPDIKKQSITVIGTDLTITPFAKWNTEQANQSLFWWAAYNNIKHSRYMNKKYASQNNVLNILGALYLVEMKYLQKITANLEQPDVPDNVSKLFSLNDWIYHYIPINNYMAVINGDITILDNND